MDTNNNLSLLGLALDVVDELKLRLDDVRNAVAYDERPFEVAKAWLETRAWLADISNALRMQGNDRTKAVLDDAIAQLDDVTMAACDPFRDIPELLAWESDPELDKMVLRYRGQRWLRLFVPAEPDELRRVLAVFK